MSRSRPSDATSSLRLGPFRCQFTRPPEAARAGEAPAAGAATGAAHIVNGRTVNVATRLQQPDPQNPGQFIPLTRGKTAIEIEYAEIWSRRIEVKAI
jgi:hypothetical protein